MKHMPIGTLTTCNDTDANVMKRLNTIVACSCSGLITIDIQLDIEVSADLVNPAIALVNVHMSCLERSS